jgi:hypothetical protein
MPPLDLQIATKAMKTQQDIDPNRYVEILQGRKLEAFLNDTWNDRWLEIEKVNGHTKYIQFFAAEKRWITIQRLKWDMNHSQQS